MTQDAETDDVRKWREEQRKFYALVGHCILRYQHVEDYLEKLFATVLGGSTSRADAIFASVRGTDRKIQIIMAAATDQSGPPWDELASLLDRVRDASIVRGKIAHANPVQSHRSRMFVQTDEDGRIIHTMGMEQVERRWELHKQSPKERVVFSMDDLQREYNRADGLFDEMIAFVKAVEASKGTTQ